MKIYEEISFEIVVFHTEDIVRTSPGGIDYGKDDNGNDLGWEA